METVKMDELTAELIALGLPARYEMTGGWVGTILIGDEDEEGRAEFAIGPSAYLSATAYLDEICWGVDGGEFARYAEGGNWADEKELALAIISDYRREVGK